MTEAGKLTETVDYWKFKFSTATEGVAFVELGVARLESQTFKIKI